MDPSPASSRGYESQTWADIDWNGGSQSQRRQATEGPLGSLSHRVHVRLIGVE